MQLMKSHDAINKSFKTKAAKNELKELILSNLDELPALVRDARTNKVRMEGLMGLAIKINNSRKQYGREKMASLVINKPPVANENGNNDNGNNDEDTSEEDEEEDESDDESSNGDGPEIHKTNDSQPRPQVNGARNHETPLESRGHDRTHDIRSDHSRTSDSRANRSSPAVVVDNTSAIEPPNKRRRPLAPMALQYPLSGPSLPQYQRPSFDFSARNIWVVNEVDHGSHGLCPVMELVKKDSNKDHLQLSDLDFDHWMLIVQAHCGYDYTVHRLEYRPSVTTIMPSIIGRPFTVPMRTPSQWRGALNSQLQTKPDQDPVFYLVYKSESRPGPSPPRRESTPFSGYDISPTYQPATRLSPTVKQEYVEELLAQRNHTH